MLQRVLAAEFGMTGRNGNGGWQSCFLWREMQPTGVGMFDAAQIAYSAADMPAVEPRLIEDPGGRRYENVIDCRWLLRCSDDTRVPRVIFSAFATGPGRPGGKSDT